MGEKKPAFSASAWLTPLQLGSHFGLTADEIRQYLAQAGLLFYDAHVGELVATEKARAEGYCAFTPLRGDELLTLWHRQKTLYVLREQAGLVPLERPDLEAHALALALIKAEKDAEQGDDKGYYEIFDSISTRKLPRVMAWALLIAHRARDPIYSRLLDSVAADELAAIDRELERIGAELRLKQ